MAISNELKEIYSSRGQTFTEPDAITNIVSLTSTEVVAVRKAVDSANCFLSIDLFKERITQALRNPALSSLNTLEVQMLEEILKRINWSSHSQLRALKKLVYQQAYHATRLPSFDSQFVPDYETS